MSLFFVERHPWQRWARVLVMVCKKNGEQRRYVPERTCRLAIVKQGPLYIVYRFDCCGREWAESMTDAGATPLEGTVCPFCGAKVVE